MNISNIKVDGDKSQSHPSTTGRLLVLASQMAACNYGADHPWRVALADVIAETGDGPRVDNTFGGIDPIRTQAYEIESRIGNIAILVEAIFDKLDGMSCDTPEHHKVHNAVSCFANSAMESAQAIRSANEQILTLTAGGVQ
jgi:hypothetical protein